MTTSTPLRRTGRKAAALTASLLLGTAAGLVAAPAASADDGGGTLRMPITGIGIDSLNPFLAYFAGSLDVFSGIYPALDRVEQDGTVKPYLADSWTTSSDKLTWTFKIHKGLKWSDGKPITAEDAAWTFNLIMKNSTAATANGSLVGNFASVSAPDATTLVVKTKKPQATMLSVSIPVSGIPIVPKHIWESHVKDLKNYKNDSFPIVGYGPWTLTDYKPEQYVKFDANKDFLLGAPKYAHMIQQAFKNTDAAVAALRSGQLDYVSGLNPTQYQALRSQSGVKAFEQVGNRWNGIEVNGGARTRDGKKIGTGHPALGDVKVREALALAIDRATIVKRVRDGLAQVGASYLPPSLPQYAWQPSGSEKFGYDPAKADSVLDAAGYKKGSDGIRVDPKSKRKLEFRLGIHSDDDADAKVSTYLAGWFKEIGVKVDIQSMSSSKLNADLAKGDWDILMDSWSTGPDPTYLLGIQTCAALPDSKGEGGSTDSFFCDKDYDDLFLRQQSAFDDKQRADLLRRMQAILYKANENIMIYNANGLAAYRTDRVNGIVAGKADSTGAFPAQNSFDQYLDATPAKASSSSSGSGSGTVIGVSVTVVVVLAAGGVFLARRRSSSDDRE
ncbi:ABC transporter substrate-binding protein [Streptomyces hygroscopicus subsp. hygroscopicus]|nr:peptide ABC transporter substrate-binding protein [Streptomyces hygroscopicus]GLX48894.1 ABC transporter substrate-binding protein [Streptomyces hygroscopicus subsp. hygroscopicus]